MRKGFASIVGSLLLIAIAAYAPSPAKATDSGFDRLKILVGDWVATGEDGKPFTNNIRLVSNGTALEETFQTDQDNQMVTLYSADGSRVALTHYCSMGNQPRMESPVVTGTTDEFVFSFTGATNLPTPDASHMHRLALQIDDADHFSETWTFRQKNGDTKRTFNFVRKK
jgi:flagellin-like protein